MKRSRSPISQNEPSSADYQNHVYPYEPPSSLPTLHIYLLGTQTVSFITPNSAIEVFWDVSSFLFTYWAH